VPRPISFPRGPTRARPGPNWLLVQPTRPIPDRRARLASNAARARFAAAGVLRQSHSPVRVAYTWGPLVPSSPGRSMAAHHKPVVNLGVVW
jgi:hypothetical protein